MMHERLSNKNITPTMEEFLAHIGAGKETFEAIEIFLTDELSAEKMLRYSSDSNVRGWGIKYSHKSKYFCDIIAEKGSFTIVIRLSDNQIKTAYEEVLPYAKKSLDNYQRTSNGGWVQYQVLNVGQLDDVKKILRIKNELKRDV